MANPTRINIPIVPKLKTNIFPKFLAISQTNGKITKSKNKLYIIALDVSSRESI